MRPSRSFAPLSVFLSLFAFAVCQACRRHAAYEVAAPCGRCWSNLLKDLSEETRKGCFGHLRWQLGSFFFERSDHRHFCSATSNKNSVACTQPFAPWLCTGATFSTWWRLFCSGRRKRRSSLSCKPASTLVLARVTKVLDHLDNTIRVAQRCPGAWAAGGSQVTFLAPVAEPAGQCGDSRRNLWTCPSWRSSACSRTGLPRNSEDRPARRKRKDAKQGEPTVLSAPSTNFGLLMRPLVDSSLLAGRLHGGQRQVGCVGISKIRALSVGYEVGKFELDGKLFCFCYKQ